MGCTDGHSIHDKQPCSRDCGYTSDHTRRATAPTHTPLIRGRGIAHVHTCGAVEYLFPEDRAELLGSCDSCESGSVDPLDWQPVFVAEVVARRLSGQPA